MKKREKEQKEVVLWSSTKCPACQKAKAFLIQKKVKFAEKRLSKASATTQMLYRKQTNGARSVPQVIIGDEHIGGLGELIKLDERGELAWKLGLGPKPEVSGIQKFLRFLKGS